MRPESHPSPRIDPNDATECVSPFPSLCRNPGWRPTLGAWIEGDGTRFRVWAPHQQQVGVVIGEEARALHPLQRYEDGTWGEHVPGVRAGARYQYRLESGDFPDPASRYQPNGVHGFSEVVDPRRYLWSDVDWRGVGRDDLVLYELHVGTFTPEGTFAGVRRRLDYLRDLGVSAIELMPIADFPGSRNWGYDGVSLFAPARCYGTPDDLRRLVDAAHARGIGVFLDVVYNHLGPDGNYLPMYSPYYFRDDHESPWGASMNFDGPHGDMVRRFFIENALAWANEYHFDGLRLDATHAMSDESEIPFVAELATRLREAIADRRFIVIAEDHRNLARMIEPEGRGGWGLDGVWADDFHHGLRVALAGDRDGYYRDFYGSTKELVETINEGWLYRGQHSRHWNAGRGTPSPGHPLSRMVVCIQNHDQVGNRALGERLHHQIDPAAYAAASVLLLMLPETPLLFMGQEWGAGAPFLYFTDHHEELGRMVTEGRRREFRDFQMFTSDEARSSIPDPQARETFERSRLDWSEPAALPGQSVLALYRGLLALRGQLLRPPTGEPLAWALSEHALLVRRAADGGDAVLAIVQLSGEGTVDLRAHPALQGADGQRCRVLLTSEDPTFASAPLPAEVDLSGAAPRVAFQRAGAVIIFAPSQIDAACYQI